MIFIKDIVRLERFVEAHADAIGYRIYMTNSNAIGSEPRLGIFWLFNDKLLMDSLELSESEKHGDYRNCPRNHIDTWEEWQRSGKVPLESPYEEYPRGRVTYDTKTKTFMLLADECILKRRDLLAEIKAELRLPGQISVKSDSHYRGFAFLQEGQEQEP
jgi:hypothetical protein